MRRLLLPSLIPAFVLAQAPAEKPMALADAVQRMLASYDYREPGQTLEMPLVQPRDRPALRWLKAAADEALPGNPFPRASKPWKEAEALRALLGAAPEQWAKQIQALPLTQAGTHLALWRWGQAQVRASRMSKELRMAWEDRLLGSGSPSTIRGYALRHTLCFALAEGDEARFGVLKSSWENENPEFFQSFQRAFALVGSPSPVLHLWRLPELESVDLPFHGLGGQQVRILPDPGQGLPDMGRDVAWVVPTREGIQPADEPELQGDSLQEARALAPRLAAAGRKAYLVPVRQALEAMSLVYFPIVIDLDAEGNIQRIRMGDAALVE